MIKDEKNIKLYTVKEAADRIRNEVDPDFKERRLSYLIRNRRIEAQKIGWIWVIPEYEVFRIIEYLKAKKANSEE